MLTTGICLRLSVLLIVQLWKFIFEVMLMTVNFRESELAWGRWLTDTNLSPQMQPIHVCSDQCEWAEEGMIKVQTNHKLCKQFYVFDSRHKLYENVDGELKWGSQTAVDAWGLLFKPKMCYNSWPSPTWSLINDITPSVPVSTARSFSPAQCQDAGIESKERLWHTVDNKQVISTSTNVSATSWNSFSPEWH